MYRALVAALVAVFLAACGGGESDSPPTTDDFLAAAEQATADALMTVEELPPFWSQGTPDDAADIELTPECDVFDLDVAFPGAASTDQAPVYLGPGETTATFITAAFHDEQAAIDAIDGQDDIVTSCREEFLDAIEQAARDEAADRGFDLGPLTSVDVELGDYESFPEMGDQTSARRVDVRIRVGIVATDFRLDIMVIRSGRMVGAMTYSEFGDLNVPLEQMIAETMTVKLAAADEELP